jgi:hypothetical protein
MVTIARRQSQSPCWSRCLPARLRRQSIRRHDGLFVCRATVAVPGLGFERSGDRFSALVRQPPLPKWCRRATSGGYRYNFRLADQCFRWRAEPVLSHRTGTERSLYNVQSQVTYVLSPSSLFQFQVGFNRQDATIQPYSYSAWWLGGGYIQDLPFGFSAGFQPSYYLSYFDAPLPAFQVTRSDHTWMLNFTLLNRRLEYHGLTPRVSYSFTDQQSNIALYRYTRSQIQLGLTSQF